MRVQLPSDYQSFKSCLLENLCMLENKTISDFNSKLCGITTEAFALSAKYSETKLVRKALRSLPKRCAYIVTAIEEVKNVELMRLDELRRMRKALLSKLIKSKALLYNNFSSEIPRCMDLKFSLDLSVLDLRENKVHGTIPAICAYQNSLINLNLNGNQFGGPLPQSLVNCLDLEILDLGNMLYDTFPHWLETLPSLRVLVLRTKRFYGSIENPKTGFPFVLVRIMDISHNNFSGALPAKYFDNFVAMMNAERVKFHYMGEKYFEDSVMITIKGLDVELVKIQSILTTIDFSSNNFTGEIPELIGKLQSLKGLNFSHNMLRGTIPPTLRNLTNLEWLALSSNELVGKIPVGLADLTSLAFLNLSYNQFEGPIPRGNQFNTFDNNSFG